LYYYSIFQSIIDISDYYYFFPNALGKYMERTVRERQRKDSFHLCQVQATRREQSVDSNYPCSSNAHNYFDIDREQQMTSKGTFF